MELSETHLRYLHAIYDLSRSTPDVRSADLAARLHVTRPSVARMLRVLTEMDLIEKKPYGKIRLTEKGARMAEKFERNLSMLTERLTLTGFPLTERETYEAARAVASVRMGTNR